MIRKFLHTALLQTIALFSYADEKSKMPTRKTAVFKK